MHEIAFFSKKSKINVAMLSEEDEGSNLFPFSISFVIKKSSSDGLAISNTAESDNVLVLHSIDCQCS